MRVLEHSSWSRQGQAFVGIGEDDMILKVLASVDGVIVGEVLSR